MKTESSGHQLKINIELNEQILMAIHQHMAACHPLEGCGILFGEPSAGSVQSWQITEFRPAANRSSQPERAFSLDPAVWVPSSLSPRLLGIVHSHPVSAPVPSQEDLKQLQSFGELIKVYMIVSTEHKNPPNHSLYGVQSGEDAGYILIKLHAN
ncbi:M67 family metallopeptidase [Paenibacillus physcomitrellae]|uniref:M67 family metallopeptidase n=1 Tax=Paenibacillus physcomitrellae TaxID=1619311 RepID=UPI000B8CA22A|nr:M67 family metallopeptidase [Paenibacillus physcomitrellae]